MMIVYKENFSNRGAMCHMFLMKSSKTFSLSRKKPSICYAVRRENEKVFPAILTLIMQ